MRILAIDIGTGTQDILFYNSKLEIENNFKMVMPSPTMIVNQQLRQAACTRTPVLLTGVTMGGGPSTWAVDSLLKSHIPVFSTPDAARTINDDLDIVSDSGIQLVSEDEAKHLHTSILRIEFNDFDFHRIEKSFQIYGISLTPLDAIAVAVFDHGAAPPNISDRQFRFNYLDQCIRKHNRLSAFAYPSAQIPKSMTRLQAIALSNKSLPSPLIVMDTAPAAILGTLFDPFVARMKRNLICNIGNLHTLAFRMDLNGIEGVFEHHTGFLNRSDMENLLQRFASGSLTNQEIFDHHGHGALVYSSNPLTLDSEEYNIIVTGPRRSMLNGSFLKPYFAVPFGDMMITGCIGLLAAVADIYPDLGQTILASLNNAGNLATAPWEIDQ